MPRSRIQSLLASSAQAFPSPSFETLAGPDISIAPDLTDTLQKIRDFLDTTNGLTDAGLVAERSDGAVGAGGPAPVGPVRNGSGDTTVAVAASGNQGIDGLLAGVRWADGYITYSFPDAASDYGAGYIESLTNFQQINAAQQLAVHFALNSVAYTQPGSAAGFSVEGFTNLTVDFTSADGSGTLRYANTSDPGTAYAYYPNNGTFGGDSFYGNSGRTPVMGNYHWHTMLHETGHALGLKHGQETGGFGAMPTHLDAMEYTVMTYRSYVGGPTTGYTNEEFGYAQTFMMYDIAALQYMYGADFSVNSGNTTYEWDPTTGNTIVDGSAAITPGGNRIFMTVWDGGGIDTYDLSAYATGVTVNLAPGSYSLLSDTQRAHLGSGNYASGNVYNALLFGGDTRSLIENATGGSGSDTLYGNQAANVMIGNAGGDYIWTSTGNDALYGGDGDDTLYGAEDNDYNHGGAGNDYIWAYIGNDTLYGAEGTDSLYGGDGDDYLSGSWGSDIDAVMDGGNGNDTLSMSFLTVGRVFDFEAGQARTGGGAILGTLVSIETFYGGSGNDVIISDGDGHLYYGQSGNDRMVAEIGAETLDGGAGFDTLDTARWSGPYVLDLATGSSNYGGEFYTNFEGAVLGGGNDSVSGTAGANMLHGGGGNDTLLGGGGNDTLQGAAGNDNLRGGGGNDTLSAGIGSDILLGGAGDDVYATDGGDAIWEAAGQGNDLVFSSVSLTLAANVERLTLTGTAGNAGAGNALNNRITGNVGNNWLNGLGGSDTLAGGGGNDTYVTDGLDVILEGAGGGVDTVRSTAGLTLAANLEHLLLIGAANINGFGNGLNNQITGNNGNNALFGALGNDILQGGAGGDTLRGGVGSDRVDGGLGSDVLWGDAGADTLIFRRGGDRIADFANNIDTIALDDALWGGLPKTIGQILAMGTEVAGDVFFNFGGGNTLLVENVASRLLLVDDILIV
ncbi:M10 family metallopeptidase C-terminal domain-containing protein [Paracoccus sp. (in: a-proteobacteria)]|uniref:M10 family metallopeptidase C-terminal domain-containing protein n=1 Tax=Paracoccus sp. TaxID=267 RepID=UPI0035AF1DF6